MLKAELEELIGEQIQKGFRDSLGSAFRESDIYNKWAEMSKIRPNKLLLDSEDTKQFNTGTGKSY